MNRKRLVSPCGCSELNWSLLNKLQRPPLSFYGRDSREELSLIPYHNITITDSRYVHSLLIQLNRIWLSDKTRPENPFTHTWQRLDTFGGCPFWSLVLFSLFSRVINILLCNKRRMITPCPLSQNYFPIWISFGRTRIGPPEKYNSGHSTAKWVFNWNPNLSTIRILISQFWTQPPPVTEKN